MEQNSINKNETISEPNIFNKEYHLSTVEIIINIFITLAFIIVIIYYLNTKWGPKFNIIKFALTATIMWLCCFVLFNYYKNNEPKIVFIKFLIAALTIIVLYEITPPY